MEFGVGTCGMRNVMEFGVGTCGMHMGWRGSCRWGGCLSGRNTLLFVGLAGFAVAMAPSGASAVLVGCCGLIGIDGCCPCDHPQRWVIGIFCLCRWVIWFMAGWCGGSRCWHGDGMVCVGAAWCGIDGYAGEDIGELFEGMDMALSEWCQWRAWQQVVQGCHNVANAGENQVIGQCKQHRDLGGEPRYCVANVLCTCVPYPNHITSV